MKARIMTLIALLSSFTLFIGCGGTGESSSGGSTSKSKGPFSVKGLYIGMDIAQAKAVASELLKDYEALDNGAVPKISEEKDIGSFDFWDVGVSGGKEVHLASKSNGRIMEGSIGYDAAGKVTGFSFDSALVKQLFGSGDMEASDFSEQFAKSYNIPSMKVADDMTYWYYDSPDGVRVRIDPEQKLNVRVMQKKSFN